MLFYRWKLKEPIRILKEGTERIRMQDLDFSIPVVSADELGGICADFETMRGALQKSNQENTVIYTYPVHTLFFDRYPDRRSARRRKQL